jgi:hypothetical protein
LVERHPNLERAVDGWIGEENGRIVKGNAEIRSKWNEYVGNYKGE